MGDLCFVTMICDKTLTLFLQLHFRVLNVGWRLFYSARHLLWLAIATVRQCHWIPSAHWRFIYQILVIIIIIIIIIIIVLILSSKAFVDDGDVMLCWYVEMYRHHQRHWPSKSSPRFQTKSVDISSWTTSHLVFELPRLQPLPQLQHNREDLSQPRVTVSTLRWVRCNSNPQLLVTV